MKFLTCFMGNIYYIYIYTYIYIYIYIYIYNICCNNFNNLIRRNKQMAFRSICFQVVEVEPFRYFFSSYFQFIHGFIKCRSTFVRSGIISKICKVRTIVLKNKSQRSMLNNRGPSIDPWGTP